MSAEEQSKMNQRIEQVRLNDDDIKEMNEKFERMKRRNLESMQRRIDKIESTMAKSVRVNTPKLLERINRIAASYEKFQQRLKEEKKLAEMRRR